MCVYLQHVFSILRNTFSTFNNNKIVHYYDLFTTMISCHIKVSWVITLVVESFDVIWKMILAICTNEIETY